MCIDISTYLDLFYSVYSIRHIKEEPPRRYPECRTPPPPPPYGNLSLRAARAAVEPALLRLVPHRSSSVRLTLVRVLQNVASSIGFVDIKDAGY